MKLKLNWLVALIVGLIIGGMAGVLATGLQFQQEALLRKEAAPQLAVSREDIAGETDKPVAYPVCAHRLVIARGARQSRF